MINILVAEDNKMNQFLIKILLEKNGFKVFIAENGEVACNELKTSDVEYSLVLMDLMMPIMNGFEATEEIRKNINPTIPIIAVTADVTSNIEEKCLQIGMNDYVSKPYIPDHLIKKIHFYTTNK